MGCWSFARRTSPSWATPRRSTPRHTPPPVPAEIPNVPLTAGYGSITGIVTRAGTGNGIDGASVILSPHDAPMSPADRRQVTGQTGGFAFDSVVPGGYRLRVLAAREHPASSFVAVTSDRIDTVRFPIQALGICNR